MSLHGAASAWRTATVRGSALTVFFAAAAINAQIAAAVDGESAAPSVVGEEFVSNRFGTLHFYVPKHEFTLHAELDSAIKDESTTRRGGVSQTKSTSNYLDMELAVVYGLVDRVRLGVSRVHPLIDDEVSTNQATGVRTTTHQTSVSNPNINASWRFFEDPAQGIYANAALNFYIKASKATGDASETVADPTASRVHASTELFLVHGVNELGLTLGIYSYPVATVTKEKASDSYRSDSYYVTTVTATDRWHVSEQMYVQASIEMNLNHSVDTHYNERKPPSEVTTKYPTRPSYSLTAGYLPGATVLVYLTIAHADFQRTSDHTVAPKDGSVTRNDTDAALGVTVSL